MNIDLTECRALVTGGSRGIGKAICEALLASGARVAVHCRAERDAAEAIVRGHAGSCVLSADLSNPLECGELIHNAHAALGGLDLLVNNAGVAISSPFDAANSRWIDEWNRTLDVNLTAAAALSRDAVNRAGADRGLRIVFIASRAAFRGDTADYVAYAASKGGMVALARSIARSFGRSGVKSFVIAPGFTRTEMAEEFIRAYGEDYAMKDIALERMTEPRDIAPLVVFLASGLADHCTGTTIDVNAASYVR
jgi:NAD(P)-dependent dehydrogenase (short-subunit alcohol dehydrogenase family)